MIYYDQVQCAIIESMAVARWLPQKCSLHGQNETASGKTTPEHPYTVASERSNPRSSCPDVNGSSNGGSAPDRQGSGGKDRCKTGTFMR